MGRLKLFIPLFIFVVMAVFLWRGLALDPTELPSALIDKKVPPFSLPQLDENAQDIKKQKILTNKDLVFKPYLLNIWATWCPTCRHEHPYLLELEEKGIPIVGLNYKDNSAAAMKWLDQLGDPYAINLFDEKGTLGLDLGVYGAPETYVVDAQGVIRYRHVGVVDAKVWNEHFASYFSAAFENY